MMTLAVYRVSRTGARTVVKGKRTVRPTAVPLVSSGWPPCACPRCRPPGSRPGSGPGPRSAARQPALAPQASPGGQTAGDPVDMPGPSPEQPEDQPTGGELPTLAELARRADDLADTVRRHLGKGAG